MLSKREYNLYASSATNLCTKHGKNDAETCEIINIIYGLTFKHRREKERGCDKDLEHVQFEGLRFPQEIGTEEKLCTEIIGSGLQVQVLVCF